MLWIKDWHDFPISSGVSSEYPQIKKLKDYQVQVVVTLSIYFNYIAFNLGHYDTKKQAAYVPTSMSISWTPVNTRVKSYDARPSATEFWSSLSLTNPKPE